MTYQNTGKNIFNFYNSRDLVKVYSIHSNFFNVSNNFVQNSTEILNFFGKFGDTEIPKFGSKTCFIHSL